MMLFKAKEKAGKRNSQQDIADIEALNNVKD